ncbi:hypothetical protein TIFTF001_030679 [Ficus carica]|uniref:50S ribosomal protein L35 n=1 Tax=Ficus carica TaxID=3494 RepID=A0AA88DUL5_FICCA|nr:hypothetical protein TIFTF001_030679 [Ficus carica]
MASSSMAVSLSLSNSPFCPRRTPPPRRSVHLAPLSSMAASLKLSSSHCISSFGLAVLPRKLSSISSSPSGSSRTRSLTIVSAKGYKMKTHKASAKRFRVTGTGKIVRRRAGKQHLLYKKNNKRKLRLSKMVGFF